MHKVEKMPVNMKKAKISRLAVNRYQMLLPKTQTDIENAHMLEEFSFTANVFQTCKTDLRDDGTELAARRGYTVCRGPVTGREGLSRNNECGSVRSEILEEVGQAVKEDEPMTRMLGFVQSVIAKALSWRVPSEKKSSRLEEDDAYP